jgi:hypothetical protein
MVEGLLVMTAPNPAERDDPLADLPNQAPSVTELLTQYGVPRHHHAAARRAFSQWLHTWQGLGMTAEQLQDRV